MPCRAGQGALSRALPRSVSPTDPAYTTPGGTGLTKSSPNAMPAEMYTEDAYNEGQPRAAPQAALTEEDWANNPSKSELAQWRLWPRPCSTAAASKVKSSQPSRGCGPLQGGPHALATRRR